MGKELKIAFIGAGSVNFGGPGQPWDHATRLEQIGGLTVVGVADPDIVKAQKALAAREAGPARKMYAGAKAYPDERSLLAEVRPDAVFVGVPPAAHGQSRAPHDMELLFASSGIHMFLEKPLAVLPPREMLGVAEALAKAARAGLIVSVGYMFRYSKAVEKMQKLLLEVPGGAKAVLARYDCAYSGLNDPHWWDIRRSGGPILDQATHFCDLARLFCGEVDMPSVAAVSVDGSGKALRLSDVPAGPDGKPVDRNIPWPYHAPIATAAVWRHEGGAVGSLTHGILLHGEKFETELEVWADGLRMVLLEPYGPCRLSVRYPGSQETQVINFSEDDPYLSEVSAFIQAVRKGDNSQIRSGYADAMKSYEFTWAIRQAACGAVPAPAEMIGAGQE